MVVSVGVTDGNSCDENEGREPPMGVNDGRTVLLAIGVTDGKFEFPEFGELTTGVTEGKSARFAAGLVNGKSSFFVFVTTEGNSFLF